MMKLLDKQQAFPRLLIKLFQFAWRNGFELTVGEVWRSPETAALYEKEGKGISGSLHCVRLAIDINLFRGTFYLTKTEDYQKVGEYWESLSKDGIQCCWGGRFESQDANHFSIAHAGTK